MEWTRVIKAEKGITHLLDKKQQKILDSLMNDLGFTLFKQYDDKVVYKGTWFYQDGTPGESKINISKFRYSDDGKFYCTRTGAGAGHGQVICLGKFQECIYKIYQHFISSRKRQQKQKEQPKQEIKQEEQQSKSKTVYSVELFNNEGDTETSTDCNSYDEAIQAMEKYRNNKTQYVDSWGLSGKGRIIKFTEDKDGNMSNEKVLKTFWL